MLFFWTFYLSKYPEIKIIFSALMCVTLDHKTSLKSLEYICSNSQKYIVWVKIIDFSFMPKSMYFLHPQIQDVQIVVSRPNIVQS